MDFPFTSGKVQFGEAPYDAAGGPGWRMGVHFGVGQMSGKAVTRAELIAAVAARAELGRADATELLEHLLGEIEAALVDGDSVKLARFGNFVVRAKRERLGRNPKTGREVPITPRRVVTFRPSQILREQVEESAPKRGRRTTTTGSS
jgi:integration host factor subunit alpha